MAKNLPRPTDGELAILQSLWAHGPSTVRQVYERLKQPTRYTTVLKLMQIMAEKGLVTRDESQRTHIYAAAQPASRTQRQMVMDLVEKAFAGSSSELVLQALSAKRASAQELKAIRELIERYESS
ncbi:MAG TPA: BlaI/MecI/CopY family transcriptional regulator [Phycisphaerae bacterium]|nr:BlaI/MecI/CopY family transcriptional regulator [Phycisphaerae bacterium]